MSRYYRSGRHSRKSLRERIGFYTAFSICLIAVAMAVYSTYNTVSRKSAVKTVTHGLGAVEHGAAAYCKYVVTALFFVEFDAFTHQ